MCVAIVDLDGLRVASDGIDAMLQIEILLLAMASQLAMRACLGAMKYLDQTT